MKIWVEAILVLHLSVCTYGDLLRAYRHYFGAGDAVDDHGRRNIARDQQQQRDTRDPQLLWTNPDPPWRGEQDQRHVEPAYERSGGGGDKGCSPSTMWIDKTVDRHMPVTMNNKESRDYKVKQTITKTIINTKSIPYFVTQTAVEPEIKMRTAILPQRITHTVRKTHLQSITKTEKTYQTVTAQRTQKFFKTVCPKGH